MKLDLAVIHAFDHRMRRKWAETLDAVGVNPFFLGSADGGKRAFG